MKTLIYILTIIFLISCKELKYKENLSSNADFEIPFILDSLTFVEKAFETKEMQVPINDIIYIGLYSDTIDLKKNDRNDYYFYLNFQQYDIKTRIKQGLKVNVSNNQLLTINKDILNPPPPLILVEGSVMSTKTNDKWAEKQINYVQSIPVFIYNPGKDTVFLDEQDGRVVMIQEAKDENGEWKPIEYF